MKISNLKPSAPVWIGAILSPVLAPAVRTISKQMVKLVFISGLRTFRVIKATALASSEFIADLYEEASEELDESPLLRKAGRSNRG